MTIPHQRDPNRRDPEDEAELWRDEAQEFAKLSRMYANLSKHHSRKAEQDAHRARVLARTALLMLGVLLIAQLSNLGFSLWRYLH